MNITLNQNDIKKALMLFVVSQGIAMDGKTLDVVFTSGRKSKGVTAALTISDADTVPAEPVVQPTPVPTPEPVVQVEVVAPVVVVESTATTLNAHDSALLASLDLAPAPSLFAPAPVVEVAVDVTPTPEPVKSLFGA